MDVRMPDGSRLIWPKVATSVSVGGAFALTLVKAWVWYRSGSIAILASFLDSLLDLAASLIAFVGVRMASKPPDENHRFGHEKAEAISSLIQLVLISGSAAFILAESMRAIIDPTPIRAETSAIYVMLFSIMITLFIISVQTFALNKSQSLAAESDRSHYIGDLLSNAGAIVAIYAATQWNWLWADAAAGLVAASFMIMAVVSIGKKTLPQLMDEELSSETRTQILEIVDSDPNVKGHHHLRTRKAGQREHIQLHLEMDANLSLNDAHQIGARVENQILKLLPNADVIVHLDPFEAE